MVKCSKNMISCLKNFPKEPHSFLGTCQRTMCPPPSRWCHLNAPNEWRRTPPLGAPWLRTARPQPAAHHRTAEVVEEEGGGEASRHVAPLETTTVNTTHRAKPSSSPTPPARPSASSPSAATQMRRTTLNSPVTPGQKNGTTDFSAQFCYVTYFGVKVGNNVGQDLILSIRIWLDCVYVRILLNICLSVWAWLCQNHLWSGESYYILMKYYKNNMFSVE